MSGGMRDLRSAFDAPPVREWTAEDLDALPMWSAVATHGSVWFKIHEGDSQWQKAFNHKIRDSAWLAKVARRIAYDPRWGGIA